MRIGVLGPLQVLCGTHGQAIEVGGARLRALLIRLALDPGRLVLGDRLVEDLWEQRPPADPAGALQSLVSRLRRVLDADPQTGRAAIGSHPLGYRLDLPPECVDAWTFEREVTHGRTALEAGEFARAAQVLHAALSLWRGDPLADAGGAGFTLGPVARLHEMRLAAVEDRADAVLASAGSPGPDAGEAATMPGLIAELTELRAAHPLRERLAVRLMRALHADGQRAAALAVHDRTRRELAEQLGTDPGPELRDVHLGVLRGLLTNSRGHSGAPAADGRPARRPEAGGGRTDPRPGCRPG